MQSPVFAWKSSGRHLDAFGKGLFYGDVFQQELV
jgi:hypothetical protein